jgi:hypothetical protein
LTTIDFGKALQDAKGASFEALPIGDYDVEVVKAEATTSSNGKPMIKTTMRVVSGPYEKRPIINNFVMSLENPQAVAIFFRHMKCFGLTEDFFASMGAQGSLDSVASALVNRRARLTLGHREWQGETRNEVKSVKPYTGAPPAMAPGGPSMPAGPATLPPRPVTAQPAPVAAPLPPAPPAAAPVATPAPVAPPQPPPAAPVQSVPQPPAPAPAPEAPVAVPTASGGDTGDVASTPTVSTPPTSESDAGQPTPPALPF